MTETITDWIGRLLDPAVYVPILVVIGVVIGLFVAIAVLRRVRQAALRAEAREALGLGEVPSTVRVRVRRDDGEPGHVHLEFPRWTYARRDGSADQRRRDNPLLEGVSTLRIGRFELRDTNPLRIYRLAVEARRAGNTVALTADERRKYEAVSRAASNRSAARHVDGIIDAFADRPTGFEEFCAEVYRARGFQADVTPPARDGGYDLLLTRGDERWIVECKCYARHVRVGRPALQKLVGANNIVGADYLVFVTTSDYTADAVAFARQLGMVLVNGDDLVRMSAEVGFGAATPTHLDVANVELSRAELLRHYPPDLRS